MCRRIFSHRDSEARSSEAYTITYPDFSCSPMERERSTKMMPLSFWQNLRYANCQILQAWTTKYLTGMENRYSARSCQKGSTLSSNQKYAKNAIHARV